LLEHLIKGYEEFVEENLFDKATHRNKIVTLSWIVATYSFLLRLPESVPYLEEMRKTLKQHDGIHEDKFKPFYVSYQNAIYYHTRQLDKSVKGRDIVHLSELPEIVLAGHIGRLAKVYFALEDYDNALKQLAPCYIAEIYDKLPREFRMEVSLMEAVIYFEKGDYSYALTLIRRIKRVYKKLLADPGNSIFKSFVGILNTVVKNNSFDLSKEQEKIIQDFIEVHPPYGEPFEKGISYRVWLAEAGAGHRKAQAQSR